MKNSLLAMLALCGATAFTMPSWAQVADPTLTFAEPDLEAIQSGEKAVFYVYHVGTGHFMTSGNGNGLNHGWGTDLVVAETGREVTLTYGKDYELSTRAKTDQEYSDAESYRLSMMDAPSNGGFHEIFLRQADLTICVDHNKQGHILWDIEPIGDGLYNIRINADDPMYGTGTGNPLYVNTMMGVNYSADAWQNYVNPLIVPGSQGYEKAGLEWRFVEPAVYETYIARKNVLKPQIDAAVEAGYPGVSEYEALYNDASSTPEALEEAASRLSEALLAYSYDQASESNPMDVTSLMKSPSFVDANGAATTSGWKTWRATNNNNFQAQANRPGVAATSDGTDHPSFFERWTPTGTPHGDYYVEQTLTGIPDGKYSLSAYIMTNQTAENGGASGLYLYGSSLAGEVATEATEASPDGGAYAAPYTVVFTVLGGEATVGMRSSGHKGNWSYVADFTLKYLGTGGESMTMQQVLNQRIEETQKIYDEELSIPQHSQAGDDKFNALMELCRAAVDNADLSSDSLMALMDALDRRVDTLRQDVSAYETLFSKTEEFSASWDASIYVDQAFPEYEDFLTGLEDAYQNRTFDPKNVDSLQTWSDRVWNQCVKDALVSGETDNVTGMLTNPNFDGNTNGWTKTGDGDFKNDGTRVVEVWNGKNWEVYQELTGLPQGSYEVTMQGYYSPSSQNKNSWQENWGKEGDQTNVVHGYLFANDASVLLPHVMSLTMDPNVMTDAPLDQFTAITWAPSLEGQYMCRLKPSAQYMFEADPTNFLNKVTCYVTEDGVLRIGTRMTDVTWDAAQVCFDNFQVKYLGADDLSGASSTLNVLIEEATELLNAETLSTTATRDALNQAIMNATEAASQEMTAAIYNEQTEALNAAMEAERAAVAAAQDLETKAEMHNDRLAYDGTVADFGYAAKYESTDGFAELESTVIEIMSKIDNDGIFASMEEIEKYDAALDQAYTKMTSGVYDYSVASKDAELDVTDLINTPSFQRPTLENDVVVNVRSAYGWVGASIADADASKVTSALNYEIFSDSSEISQKLYNMPAGYYRVELSGFYRAGGYVDAALLRRDSTEPINAELYLKSGENEWTEKLASIFADVREFQKYDSGDVFLADTLLPDMADMAYRIIVNGVTGANVAFENGKYDISLSFHVAEGEEPVLGVRKTAKLTNDWTCFDNFRLYYLGDGDANRPDDFTDSVEDVVAEGTAEVVSTTWATLNGMKVSEPKQSGIYIRIDKMSDGSTKAMKVLVK